MSDLSRIVSEDSSAEILRAADIKMAGIGLALKNVDVCESIHVFWGVVLVLRRRGSECKSILLACRVVACRQDRCKTETVRLRQGYGATVFASPLAASKDWSLGDSNP